MQGVGGRVYLVFTEDLLELAESREYRNMPGVTPSLITGFVLPNHILNKARQYMSTMVSYIRDAAAYHQQSHSQEALVAITFTDRSKMFSFTLLFVSKRVLRGRVDLCLEYFFSQDSSPILGLTHIATCDITNLRALDSFVPISLQKEG